MTIKTQQTRAGVSQLQEMFPSLPVRTLQSALLAAAGSVEKAAMALLDGPQESTPVQRRGRLQSRVGDTTNKGGSGWHALAAEQQRSHPTQAAPHYVTPRDHSQRLDSTSHAFPSLQASQNGQGFLTPQPQRQAAAWTSPRRGQEEMARPHSQPPLSRQWPLNNGHMPPKGSSPWHTPPQGTSPWATPPRGRSPPAAARQKPFHPASIQQEADRPVSGRSASVDADAELARRLSEQLNAHNLSQPMNPPPSPPNPGQHDAQNGWSYPTSAHGQAAQSPAPAKMQPVQQIARGVSPEPAELAQQFGRQLAISAGWSYPPANLGPGGDSATGEDHNGDGKLARLSERYPWADLELLQAVLVAADWDLPAADFLMSENRTPGASPARSPANTPLRFRPQQLRDRNPAQRGSSRPVDSSDDETAFAHTGTKGTVSMGKYPENDFAVEARGPRKAQQSPKPSPEPRKVYNRPVSRHRGAVADSSDDEALLARLRDADSANGVTTDDIYRKHRGHALAMDHKWRRKVDKAAGMLRAGDRSGSKAAFQEARLLRDQALREHAQAAQLIESETNAGKGLWELDLHGLHRNEAILAVGRRLAVLESSVRQPGEPLDLKVIVGRGSHSEGGEATIARATQNRLSALDYKFEPRGGVLLVRPKRQK